VYFWVQKIHKMETDLLRLVLPEKLLDHFAITEVKEVLDNDTKKMCYHILLEEYNKIPEGYIEQEYESKGFYPAKTIQDFPIRGKAVFLIITRRRWRHKVRKEEVIHSDYTFIAEGSRITKELSDFLKDTGRYPRGYDK